MHTRGFQKGFQVLVIGLGVLLFLCLNGTITLAHVGLETPSDSRLGESRYIFEAQATAVAAPPPVQGAASTTVFLPIITRNPRVPTGCNPTDGSGGLAPGTYSTTVAGLNSTVIVGQGYNPAETTYLSFYIHGNDGDIDRFKSSSNQVNKLVNKYGWIFVAPHSPQGNSWSSPWDESLNQAFADALDEMFARYNVCRRIVIGSTVSGGSIFWTRNFFPLRGTDYQAHTSILCGALKVPKASRPLLTQLSQDPNIVANSTFDYIYGTNDYLEPDIQLSITEYTAAGFNVQELVIQNAGHCNEWLGNGLPNTSQRIADDWEDRIQELNLE